MEWEEYKQEYYSLPFDLSEWQKTNFECPECGGVIYKNIRYVFATYPPKYTYRCSKCNWTEVWY